MSLTKHILVVDDQENWRRALRTLLGKEGFKISEASTFQEGREMLTKSTFDLVILDVRLADNELNNVEGIELLHLIKTHSPTTKTIVMTGYPESLRRSPDADAFILKVPKGSTFDFNDFKETVKKLLGMEK